MTFNRIRISKDATAKLSIIKGRTCLTPNILCRFAFCLSINESVQVKPSVYDDACQEFNRHTLTGEFDSFFMALLKERMLMDGLNTKSESEMLQQFKGHLNRGVGLLYSRVKNIGDLYNLLPAKMQKIRQERVKNAD